jgi:thiol:disulfide interchange protein DsbC
LSEYKADKMNKSLGALSESKMIIMGPKEGERYITVFTDIDCGYCRKLHFETIPKLVDAGVKIRYLLWPRAGLESESYDKAVSAYCSDDPVQALTDAKAGKDIEPIVCENPVAEHFKIGIDGGVRGTPNIVLDNGTIIPGYVPAERILGQLETAG